MIIDINAFNAVQPAISKDATRPHLMGVHIEDKDDKRVYVGTNGHIMLIVETERPDDSLPDGQITILSPKQIPAKYNLAELLTVDNETAVIKTDKGKTALDICDGAYPDWRKVLPAETTPHATQYMKFDPKYTSMLADFIEKCHTITPRAEDNQSPALWIHKDDDGQRRIACLMPMRGGDSL